jgi:hypothetical protein
VRDEQIAELRRANDDFVERDFESKRKLDAFEKYVLELPTQQEHEVYLCGFFLLLLMFTFVASSPNCFSSSISSKIRNQQYQRLQDEHQEVTERMRKAEHDAEALLQHARNLVSPLANPTAPFFLLPL